MALATLPPKNVRQYTGNPVFHNGNQAVDTWPIRWHVGLGVFRYRATEVQYEKTAPTQRYNPVTMSLSVVVPYYNEAEYLPATLSSLIAQTLRPFRLVLVDNGSTDGSELVCREQLKNCDGINVKYIQEPRPGKISALQAGLRQIDSDIVALCDADTCYPPHYLSLCHEILETAGDTTVAAMALQIYQRPNGLRAKARRRFYVLLSRVFTKQAFTGGSGQIFRTEALKRAGGFSEELWPYVLLDHEVMQRIFKIGTSRYHYDLWCMPSMRRSDRSTVRWSLAERLLYFFTWHPFKDWYFYRFLGPRLEKRGKGHLRLREKTWS